MTDIQKLIEARTASDPRLKAVLKKLDAGTATLNDSAYYAEIYSNITGKVFGANVLDLDIADREGVCEELLRSSYGEINSICAQVQTALDETAGIHIRPQKAAFPTERVRQIAHSLTDPTVGDDTIKRRANTGVANVSKSFHDDYIKQNAKFRNDAGLKCYITRMGTNCCDWCSEVAGKYRFGDQPDDIFRRHDNCDCTIIYDNQVLRGKLDADGRRTKTWEEIGEVPADYQPTVFTQEQAKELERRNLQYRGLTNGSGSDKIRNIKIDDIYSAIEGGEISDDVAKVIFDTLNEDNSQHLFDNVAVIKTESNIVMQTDPIKKGTFFDTRLNLNESFLGGKSVEQLDEEFRNTDYTVANSFREAVIHEKYHAKIIDGLNQAQLEALYDSLSEYHIDGISQTAWKDGSECIAEIGVLFERGETYNLPSEAKELFNKYIGGIV